MAIWIQSLSYALIYALAQGLAVFATLWIVLKSAPASASSARYRLSLLALAILPVWFAGTWWQQYHLLAQAYSRATAAGTTLPIAGYTVIDIYGTSHPVLSSVQQLSPWLAAFYAGGVVLMLGRLCAGMLQLQLLRRSSIIATPPQLLSLLHTLQARLQMSAGVQLLLSARAQVPMVLGSLRPVILLPAAIVTQLTPQQLEAILLHELAHIKRHDYLANILQNIAETILFFNPFAWQISAIIRREREHCCDDLVLDHTREPLYYATALATLAASNGTASTFAMAATGSSNQLFNRIKRIMEMKKKPMSYSRMAAAIMVAGAVVCSIAWLTPAMSQSGKNQSPADSSSTTVLVPTPNTSEETTLVNALKADKLVNEIDGFLVVKTKNKLIINGREQPADMAMKYLVLTTKPEMHIQVFSFAERLKMHPDANFLQILVPVTMGSGCVDYGQPKEGC